MDKPEPKIHHEFYFSSLQELLDYTVNQDSPLPDMCRESRRKTTPEWSGADCFETAHHLATFGWPEGLKKIRAITKDIMPQFSELFPRQDCAEELHHDVAGAYEDPVVADIGIEPEDMVNFKSKFSEIKQGNTLQRLIIETAVSSFITPETMFARGACILAMLESLETFGFRLEVILQCTINARSSGGAGGDLVIFRTCIKAFDEHSDYDKFAFCIANAAFLRRLMFSCMETCNKDIISKFGFSTSGSYGYPHNHPMYMDPDRDFYMTRPLENQSLAECILSTVDLINARYKGFVQTVENPALEGPDAGNAEPKKPSEEEEL